MSEEKKAFEYDGESSNTAPHEENLAGSPNNPEELHQDDRPVEARDSHFGEAFWFDPEGKMFQVKDDHRNWAMQHKQELQDEYGLVVGDDADRLMYEMLDSGWVRATRTSSELAITVGNLIDTPSIVEEIIDGLYDPSKDVIVGDQTNDVRIGYPEKSILPQIKRQVNKMVASLSEPDRARTWLIKAFLDRDDRGLKVTALMEWFQKASARIGIPDSTLTDVYKTMASKGYIYEKEGFAFLKSAPEASVDPVQYTMATINAITCTCGVAHNNTDPTHGGTVGLRGIDCAGIYDPKTGKVTTNCEENNCVDGVHGGQKKKAELCHECHYGRHKNHTAHQHEDTSMEIVCQCDCSKENLKVDRIQATLPEGVDPDVAKAIGDIFGVDYKKASEAFGKGDIVEGTWDGKKYVILECDAQDARIKELGSTLSITELVSLTDLKLISKKASDAEEPSDAEFGAGFQDPNQLTLWDERTYDEKYPLMAKYPQLVDQIIDLIRKWGDNEYKVEQDLFYASKFYMMNLSYNIGSPEGWKLIREVYDWLKDYQKEHNEPYDGVQLKSSSLEEISMHKEAQAPVTLHKVEQKGAGYIAEAELPRSATRHHDLRQLNKFLKTWATENFASDLAPAIQQQLGVEGPFTFDENQTEFYPNVNDESVTFDVRFMIAEPAQIAEEASEDPTMEWRPRPSIATKTKVLVRGKYDERTNNFSVKVGEGPWQRMSSEMAVSDRLSRVSDSLAAEAFIDEMKMSVGTTVDAVLMKTAARVSNDAEAVAWMISVFLDPTDKPAEVLAKLQETFGEDAALVEDQIYVYVDREETDYRAISAVKRALGDVNATLKVKKADDNTTEWEQSRQYLGSDGNPQGPNQVQGGDPEKGDGYMFNMVDQAADESGIYNHPIVEQASTTLSVIIIDKNGDEKEVEVEYNYTEGSPARMYGHPDDWHDSEGSEIEILKMFWADGGKELTKEEFDQVLNDNEEYIYRKIEDWQSSNDTEGALKQADAWETCDNCGGEGQVDGQMCPACEGAGKFLVRKAGDKKKCKQCGKEFTPHSDKEIYCSKACWKDSGARIQADEDWTNPHTKEVLDYVLMEGPDLSSAERYVEELLAIHPDWDHQDTLTLIEAVINGVNSDDAALGQIHRSESSQKTADNDPTLSERYEARRKDLERRLREANDPATRMEIKEDIAELDAHARGISPDKKSDMRPPMPAKETAGPGMKWVYRETDGQWTQVPETDDQGIVPVKTEAYETVEMEEELRNYIKETARPNKEPQTEARRVTEMIYDTYHGEEMLDYIENSIGNEYDLRLYVEDVLIGEEEDEEGTEVQSMAGRDCPQCGSHLEKENPSDEWKCNCGWSAQ